MKKIFYTILAAAAILTGCNDKVLVPGGKGTLSLDLDYNAKLTTRAGQTDAEIIDALIIDIYRANGEKARPSTPYADLKGKAIELGSGTYTIVASSEEQRAAAFEQPIFEGSEQFEIKIGQATKVDLMCSIKNVKVTVLLSEGFHNELSGYTVTVSNGLGSLTWNKTSEESDFVPDEASGNTMYRGKQAGYFTVAPLTVVVDGYRDDGTPAQVTAKIPNVNVADHHIIKLDADVTGSLNGINITISNKVNNLENPVIVGGFEEIPVEGDKEEGGEDNPGTDTPDVPEVPAGPQLTWPLNPEFKPLTLDADGNIAIEGGSPLDVVELTITAEKQVKEFKIEVTSNVLAGFIAFMAGGLTVENNTVVMDLINNDDIYNNLHADLEGLPMKDEVYGKTEVPLSMTSLVPMINTTGPTPGDVHVFNIQIVDMEGNPFEKSLTIKSI